MFESPILFILQLRYYYIIQKFDEKYKIKMPLMTPQLLQDKALNPKLASEALPDPVPTAPCGLSSLYSPGGCSGLGLGNNAWSLGTG